MRVHGCDNRCGSSVPAPGSPPKLKERILTSHFFGQQHRLLLQPTGVGGGDRPLRSDARLGRSSGTRFPGGNALAFDSSLAGEFAMTASTQDLAAEDPGAEKATAPAMPASAIEATAAQIAAAGADVRLIAATAVSTWRDIDAALSLVIGRRGFAAL